MQSREMQGRETQDREMQDREMQGRETQDREMQDREMQDREMQDREMQDREMQDKETQDKETQDKGTRDKKPVGASRKSKIYNYTTYALMTALMCIFAPISVPIGPIPISITNLILYFAIFIIGTGGTFISYIVYLLLGIIGLPVFSGFVGGIAKVAGPTGGYLLGFIPMIFIMGTAYSLTARKNLWINAAWTMAGMIVGTAVAYAFGTLWFVKQMDVTWEYALGVCVIPFIPFDLGKMVLANILGRAVRRPLVKQGLISR